MNGFIRVSAEKWAKFKALKEKARAIEREAQQLEAEMAIPGSAEMAKQLNLSASHAPKGEIVVQDLNGNPIGKFTVYWRDGYEMPGAFIRR